MSKAQDRAEAADLLDRAALTIEERGHWKGALHGPAGEVCMAGSLGVHREFGHQVWSVAAIALAAWIDGPIGVWNDAEHRTAEQVVKEMRACAADLRAKL